MNTYNVITLFPNLIEEWKNIGIVRQAIKNQLVNIETTNLREFGIGEYKQVDDAPYGGGPGMVLMPEPLDNAINSSNSEVNVFLTPSGEQLDETLLTKLLSFKSINLIAGRYEGFDQRILDIHADYKVSIGHTVISGGEVPAMYLLEALIRRIPGVLGNPDSLSKSQLDEIKNNKSINYLGHIDISKELHNYDVNLVMSKYEGSSRILLESLYIGLICISNNIPGTTVLSSKFSNSFFVNDNNIQEFKRNLNEIINNDAFLDSTQNEYFGNGADYNRKLINENYTSIKIAAAYNKIYQYLRGEIESYRSEFV